MIILGIETSCDETSVAILKDTREVLAHEIRTQLDEHIDYQGVVPEIAARAHLNHLMPILKHTLAKANITLEEIDLFTATTGPGLIGGVVVGAVMAKMLAAALGKPFRAVNHLAGHALSPRLIKDIPFPYGLLLVSGGHTQLLRVEGPLSFKQFGSTLDDALGECFDKCAKVLNLGYPGGPALEKAAQKGDEKRFAFPRPLLGKSRKLYGCSFSLSGLKTAVRTCYHDLGDKVCDQDRFDIAASFQAALVDVLKSRVQNFMNQPQNQDLRTFVAAGGVAANLKIRQALEHLCQSFNVSFEVPPPQLCTDNAAMIAWAGFEAFELQGASPLSSPAQPRWPLEEV